NKFIESLPDDHKKPIILGAFLRSLPRASYLEESQVHYGLGKFKYCHFTSPIRRYPDPLVHQQLWEFDTKGKLRSKKTVSKYAEECSEKEENNDEAYYAATDRLKLKYLEQENSKAPGTLYEGLITKITSSGLVVDITQLGVFGFVPVEYLGGRFKYNKRESNLRGERGQQGYKCGDFIFLHLDKIDFIRGSAIFRPVR
ncbi:MAG: RNB domain-containing ribonuclease, partial [Candidatus Izemoplasmatales bacterium]|nr:RNB domain-containing ribonuclease [Candidatus Izemoplasmatales bacterium]